MSSKAGIVCKIIPFPSLTNRIDGKALTQNKRKSGINKNKEGSVRLINGKVYFDFYYLGERCRELYGMPPKQRDVSAFFNDARKDLDKVMDAIRKNSFHYANIFPDSRKKDKIAELEIKMLKRFPEPSQITLNEFVPAWEKIHANHIKERTLHDYRSYLRLYLKPFFGERSFAEFDLELLSDFYDWARDLMYRGRSVSNTSLNKYVALLNQISDQARYKNQWITFIPFLGYKKLPENDPYYDIEPFDISEQSTILSNLQNESIIEDSSYWFPYIDFAFGSGISPGEQQALFCRHVCFREGPKKGTVRIEQAITINKDGKIIIAGTKNRYRTRTLIMNERMQRSVKAQIELRKKNNIDSKFFFCMPDGSRFDPSYFISHVWRPLLQFLDINYRPVRQARHSFTTYHMQKGEDPLSIAKFLGHRDTEMIFKIYAKWKDKFGGVSVGNDEMAYHLGCIENAPVEIKE